MKIRIYVMYSYCLVLNSCIICFRCLVNVSLKTTNLPTDLLPGNSQFNKMVERDVLMNVYKDGVFGSYRRTPFLKSKLFFPLCLWTNCSKYSFNKKFPLLCVFFDRFYMSWRRRYTR